jgi:hypothetical protein
MSGSSGNDTPTFVKSVDPLQPVIPESQGLPLGDTFTPATPAIPLSPLQPAIPATPAIPVTPAIPNTPVFTKARLLNEGAVDGAETPALKGVPATPATPATPVQDNTFVRARLSEGRLDNAAPGETLRQVTLEPELPVQPGTPRLMDRLAVQEPVAGTDDATPRLLDRLPANAGAEDGTPLLMDRIAAPQPGSDDGSDDGNGDNNGNGNGSYSNATPATPGAYSGQSVYVNTGQLALGMPAVTALSMRLGTIFGGISALDSLGECWGGPDDDTGKQFGEAYMPARDQMHEGLYGTKSVLDSTADGINTMVRGYSSTEDANTIPNLGPVDTGEPKTKG